MNLRNARSSPETFALCAFALVIIWFGRARTSAAPSDYSTYFSGPGYDGLFAVAVDAAGNAYVGGGTTSTTSFPVLNALQPGYGGGFSDGFVAKLNSEGVPVFVTYLGGAGADFIYGVVLDNDGNIIVAGNSHSVDLPTTDDAFQPEYNGGSAFGYGDGFIAKLTPDGSRILYCSFFGGNGDEKINGIAIDLKGNLCITGDTDSMNLPLRNALQPGFGGGETDGFVAKFDATLTNLVFSTYFGAENREQDQKIAIDPNGFIYLCGATFSTNFPVTPGTFQTNHVILDQFGPTTDAFVAKLPPDGSPLVYSTYIGSALNDTAYAIAVDTEGSAYITGEIRTVFKDVDFGFQPELARPEVDGYIAKLAPDGSKFAWFSYLGGRGSDRGYGIALDDATNVFVTGLTDSIDFPIVNAVRPEFAIGSQGAFVAKVSPNGKKLLYSGILPAPQEQQGVGLAVDTEGAAVIVGQLGSVFRPEPIDDLEGFPPLETQALVTRITPVGRPILEIRRAGVNVLLSWPTNYAGFSLEASASLGIVAPWKSVPGEPVVLGNQNAVVQAAAGAPRFFRLSAFQISEGP
jgi:hypothetical protein